MTGTGMLINSCFYLIQQLVQSIEFVRESGNLTEEFFGLVILPIVSFAADGAVAIVYFIHSYFIIPAVYVWRNTSFRTNVDHSREWKLAMDPPTTVAEARAIDLSIQFMLFWMPFLVLLGWWSQKPMSLLFGTLCGFSPFLLLSCVDDGLRRSL